MRTGQKAAALLAAGSGIASAVDGGVLYTQAPHSPGGAGDGLSCFSGGLPTVPPMYDREIGDDFTIPAGPGWTITRVSGNFIQNIVGDPNPVTGADIKFFSFSGG